MSVPRSLKPAVASLRRILSHRPSLAIVLGSGFGHLAQAMEVAKSVPYSRLSGFPKTTVAGHGGELLAGSLGGIPLIVLSGRAHYYEGYALDEVTFAVRVLAALGVSDLLLTNAAGGIKTGLSPGDFMLVTDHINFMGVNPLRGPETFGFPRFVDLTRAYDTGLNNMMLQAARAAEVKLKRGVYLAVSGPSYETPAEVRAFSRLGADAVGMSTVPEAIVARQCGLRVAAVSCITNLAAGVGHQSLSHEEVLSTGQNVQTIGARLLEEFVALYARSKQQS